jgi:hypothetical protein
MCYWQLTRGSPPAWGLDKRYRINSIKKTACHEMLQKNLGFGYRIGPERAFENTEMNLQNPKLTNLTSWATTGTILHAVDYYVWVCPICAHRSHAFKLVNLKWYFTVISSEGLGNDSDLHNVNVSYTEISSSVLHFVRVCNETFKNAYLFASPRLSVRT